MSAIGINIFSDNNKLIGNSIDNTTSISLSVGISIDSTNNVITSNSINNSKGLGGTGMWVTGINNLFYHNNLIKNKYMSAYENGVPQYSNNWDNGEEGNYWDDYTGIDADGDGIGGTPYLIDGGDNQDNYPLMTPYVF